MTPCGAICDAPPIPVPGACRDIALVRIVQALDLALPGFCTLADKGFMMHSEFAALGHTLITPDKACVSPVIDRPLARVPISGMVECAYAMRPRAP